MATIGFDGVLGIKSAAVIINKLHESHAPQYRWIMSSMTRVSAVSGVLVRSVDQAQASIGVAGVSRRLPVSTCLVSKFVSLRTLWPAFAQSLSRLRLVDEHRLVLQPVALGTGLPLFAGLTAPLVLDLIEARAYADGAVLHVYRPLALPRPVTGSRPAARQSTS